MQGQWFFRSRTGMWATIFDWVHEMLIFWTDGCRYLNIPPQKVHWGGGGGGEALHVLHMHVPKLV
jgi:hypothetical protein